MKKTILLFGTTLPDIAGVDSVDFTSDRSMLDADIVAAELSFEGFKNSSSRHDGLPVLTESSSFAFREATSRWKTNIHTALSSGKTVFIFLTSKTNRFFHNGNNTTSGSGRNITRVSNISPCSNYDFLPFQLPTPVYGRGSSMSLDQSASEILGSYWEKLAKYSTYNVYFDDEKLTSLIRTKSGKKIVSFISESALSGRVVILPELVWDDELLSTYSSYFKIPDADRLLAKNYEEIEESETSAAMEKFTANLRDLLVGIDEHLAGGRAALPPPDWAELHEYRLEVEAIIEADIINITSSIGELESRRSDLRTSLSENGHIRNLLYGKGPPLERAVREALRDMGFDAENFRSGDSEFDALFSADGYRFIGEVEGKDSKAINIEKASQLQRNVGEDFSREEVDDPAIAVLFGNAQRLLAPEERGEFFTDKVISFAKVANIALVRTTDLFRVALHLRNNPNSSLAENCRTAIRLGVGGIVTFPAVPQADSTLADTVIVS